MKNKSSLTIIIAALIFVIILLIFKNNNRGIAKCCKKERHTEKCTSKQRIPKIENLVDTHLYYKIDDHCNFQTLLFQPCFESDDDTNNNMYSVVGRFNGSKHNDSVYAINTLEVKLFFFNILKATGNYPEFKIGGIKTLPTSTSKHVQISFKLVKGKSGKNESDYVYGIHNDEHPILISNHEKATISFYVEDTKGKDLKSMGCYDLIPSNVNTGGGYECNGKPVPPGGP